MKLCFAPLLFGAMLALAGCSKSDKTFSVSGTVTLDNTPLAEGEIHFIPEDGKGPCSGKIVQGSYQVASRAGKCKVEISAFKEDPELAKKKAADPVLYPIDTRVNYLPEKYNRKTELSADVDATKKSFDFKLDLKK